MTHPKADRGYVQGLVQVEDVVVGELLSVEDLRLGDGDSLGEGHGVEGGLLVGVLSVPEVADLLDGLGPGCGEQLLGEAGVHLAGDHRIVVGGDGEGVGHEGGEQVLSDLPSGGLHGVQDVGVLLGSGDDCHGLVVLGGGTDHAGSSDVDVLDDLLEGGSLFEDGLFEGVEVDDDHVDGLDTHVGDGLHVLGNVPPCQDSGVDLGVESLDAAVEHLGESGDLGHLDDLDAVLVQKPVGSAGGDDLHTHGCEGLGELHDTGLVRYADDCSLDFYQIDASVWECFGTLFLIAGGLIYVLSERTPGRVGFSPKTAGPDTNPDDAAGPQIPEEGWGKPNVFCFTSA